MPVTIRKMEEHDFETVRDLADELNESGLLYDRQIRRNWAHTKAGERYFKKFLKDKGVCFVALDKETIVGFASVSFHRRNDWRLIHLAEVDNLYLKERYRGKGVGKRLLENVMAWAKEQKADRVMIYAFAGNTEALRFYQREGYTPYEIVLEQSVR